MCVLGPDHVPESSSGAVVAQQRLDQTSTCLEAALKAVETKLNQEENSDRCIRFTHVLVSTCFLSVLRFSF